MDDPASPATPASSSYVMAWAKLLRLPNLLTVPGDVLVGFAAATMTMGGGVPADLLAALLAALFFYAAGLIINDLADCARDRVERPDRPLASGRIRRAPAVNVAGVLMTLALVFLGIRGTVPMVAGIALGGLILLYNMKARVTRLGGAVVMGLCRAGSVLLGIVAANPTALRVLEVQALPIVWFLYIATVSWLATREVEERPYGRERWIPLVVVFVGGLFMLLFSAQTEQRAISRAVFALAFTILVVYQAGLMLGRPLRWKSLSGRMREVRSATVYPPAIGGMISALLPLQAAMLILYANEPWILLAAVITLILWPINRWLARRIPPS